MKVVTSALSYKLKVHGKEGITELSINPEETLYKALVENKLNTFPAPCAGKGTCGKCKVRVDGPLSEMKDSEKKLLKDKTEFRLACFVTPEGDCELWMEDEAKAKIALYGERKDVVLDPAGPVSSGGAPLGVAVDIGTTTVVTYLYDLVSGNPIDIRSGLNDQRAYGADVISRINYCKENEGGLKLLSDLVVEEINRHSAEICKEHDLKVEDIGYFVIAGNTVMQHIFSEIDPLSIAHAPFTPKSLFHDEHKASDLKLKGSPDAICYLTPSIAGYVGGDITADVLAAQMDEHPGNCLLLDIGTNGEIALGGKNGILCCATAAGPAFEGGQIVCGMGGIDGAISHVWWEDGEINVTVLGDIAPKGICGSGLVDAIATLLEIGAVDETGKLLPKDEAPEHVHKYLREVDGGLRFYLKDEVFISTRDVREIQLAKAAIAGGIQTMIYYAEIEEKDVDVIFLAGGFGNYINQASAVKIGLLPPALLDKIQSIGNSAGMGAICALLSKKEIAQLGDIQKLMKYIELSSNEVFMDKYVECMSFE